MFSATIELHIAQDRAERRRNVQVNSHIFRTRFAHRSHARVTHGRTDSRLDCEGTAEVVDLAEHFVFTAGAGCRVPPGNMPRSGLTSLL